MNKQNILTRKLIAIGASAGGVEALSKIVPHFPANFPPVVMVVHMPQGFTKMLATRLSSLQGTCVKIKEAISGDSLLQGQVLIAPAGKHMRLIEQSGGKLSVECFMGEKVQGVMPSADVLFESVANLSRVTRANAIGVILTGLGADGAKGLKMMRDNGARTIGQNKETSAIYGMPKVAMDIGAVEYQLPLNQIVGKILSLL